VSLVFSRTIDGNRAGGSIVHLDDVPDHPTSNILPYSRTRVRRHRQTAPMQFLHLAKKEYHLQLANKNKFQVVDGGRMSPLEAARRWAGKGYYVIPIPYRQKRPEIAEWQNLRLRLEDLPRHFGTNPQNVGLLLGEPYGVTDIDMDCPEALKVWQTFAATTKCVFGHQSKPLSHFLYHIDPPGPSFRLSDPIDRATLIELRCLSKDGSPGYQTVIPPSTHKIQANELSSGADSIPIRRMSKPMF
jgi:hypothetical protein